MNISERVKNKIPYNPLLFDMESYISIILEYISIIKWN